jgi:two-component system phosphate regulon sensor histidine kinase PhoR
MIFRSPLFRKLLLTGFLLIVVSLVAVDVLLTRYTAGRELDHVKQELATAARILGPRVAAIEPTDLGAWVGTAERESRARVTLIDSAGVVLADSQHSPATMDNHGQRPEVREALAGRRGTAVRHSATLDVDFCYLAMPVQYQGRTAVLRLAFPLQDVRVAIAEVRWRFWRRRCLRPFWRCRLVTSSRGL